MNPKKPGLLLAILLPLGVGMPDEEVVVEEAVALSTVGAIIGASELLPAEKSALT